MNRTLRVFILGSLLAVLATLTYAGEPNMFRKVSDFDGDGRADFAVIRSESGNKIWYVWQSTAGYKIFHWGAGFDVQAAGDYNADGVTDFAVFRDTSTLPPRWTYHILESGSNIYTIKTFTDFANFGHRRVHQDYNGDGRVDAGLNLGEFGLFTNLQVQFSGPSGASLHRSRQGRCRLDWAILTGMALRT